MVLILKGSCKWTIVPISTVLHCNVLSSFVAAELLCTNRWWWRWPQSSVDSSISNVCVLWLLLLHAVLRQSHNNKQTIKEKLNTPNTEQHQNPSNCSSTTFKVSQKSIHIFSSDPPNQQTHSLCGRNYDTTIEWSDFCHLTNRHYRHTTKIGQNMHTGQSLAPSVFGPRNRGPLTYCWTMARQSLTTPLVFVWPEQLFEDSLLPI